MPYTNISIVELEDACLYSCKAVHTVVTLQSYVVKFLITTKSLMMISYKYEPV